MGYKESNQATQEDPSWHNWKSVDWDLKKQNKTKNMQDSRYLHVRVETV